MLMLIPWQIMLAMMTVGAQEICNGYAAYCDKKYSDLSYTGSHDSAFIRTSAFTSLFGNQFYSVTSQLESGVRMLQAQVQVPVNGSSSISGSSGIQLCHTACALPGADFGPVETYLSDIERWLAANTQEVLTILWVNGGAFPAATWEQAYRATSLMQHVYTPPSASAGVLAHSAWPTLGQLIANHTRLISFIDTGADFAAVPWLLDEFSNVWETSYDVTSLTGFACTLDRPGPSTAAAAIPASQKLYLINHFLDYVIGDTGIVVPNVTFASVTNSASRRTGSLSGQVENCTAFVGRQPNFMLVDFFDQGNGSSLATAAQANNVTYAQSALFPGAFAVAGSDNYTSLEQPFSSMSSASPSPSSPTTSATIGQAHTSGGPVAAPTVSSALPGTTMPSTTGLGTRLVGLQGALMFTSLSWQFLLW